MHLTSDRRATIAGLILAMLSLSAPAQGQKKHVTVSGSDGFVDVTTEPPNALEMGLKVYPGAKLKAEGNGFDGAASVKVQTSEGLTKVQVMTFATSDPAAKVLAFYKKELSRYGDVIECRNSGKLSLAGREQTHSTDLTCDSDGERNATVLHSGSEHNQRSVIVREAGAGTEFVIIHVEGTDENHEIL